MKKIQRIIVTGNEPVRFSKLVQTQKPAQAKEPVKAKELAKETALEQPVKELNVQQPIEEPIQMPEQPVEPQPKKIRAAAYCRVSTLLEEQELSYESQTEYYKGFIESNPNMELVAIYGDHGASGLRTEKRPQFKQMMQDAMDGKIDVIYTKSVSRLARNAIDCQRALEQLHSAGVHVVFEKEGIESNADNVDLILKILESIAQQQSNSQSQAILWTVDHNAALGRPAYKCCFGYVKENVDDRKATDRERHAWSINEEEAVMVRTMFDIIENGGSTYDVAKRMTEMETERGNNFKWKSCKVCWMLRNIAYKGDLLTHKTVVKDYLTGKAVKNNGYREQFYIKDHHPAIISEAQFDKVQEILDQRSKTWKEKRAYEC